MIVLNIMFLITTIIISLIVMLTFPKLMEFLDRKLKSSSKT
jgi:hypothetical protein